MNKNQTTLLLIIISIFILSFTNIITTISLNKLKKEEKALEKTINKEYSVYMEPISKALWVYMEQLGIDTSVQKIIYAQAIIESNAGKTSTNVLGICNANGKPRKYDFWWQSVDDYYKYFYSKWDGNEDYITFLKHSKYNPYPTYWVKLEYVTSLLN